LSVASAVSVGPRPRPSWRAGRTIGNLGLALLVFLGAFVIDEPAPYEVLLLPSIVIAISFGLTLNRHFAPMVALLLLYIAGGWLSLTALPEPTDGILYMATTTLLVASAIFFAAVIAPAPEERLRIIGKAYVAGAVVAALLGLAGYFHLFAGADIFTLYDRLRGPFKDPNVIGPFLVLPITLLFRAILADRLSRSLGRLVLLLILLAAEFLTFSRAAWGMTIFAALIVTALAYASEERAVGRARILAFAAIGVLAAATLLVAVLSIPGVSSMFEQRAELVESYDAGTLGRFGRHILGFFLVQAHPLGIGPLAFSKILGEDEHNMWLKGFTTYGWLGGFAYIALAVWTLAASLRLLVKPRPWQPFLQAAFAVYAGHLLIHNVIDNDHWRHLFLLYGILWGIIAAEKGYARDRRRARAADRIAFGERSR
jgi:hypothetical protein